MRGPWDYGRVWGTGLGKVNTNYLIAIGCLIFRYVYTIALFSSRENSIYFKWGKYVWSQQNVKKCLKLQHCNGE